MSKWAEVHKLNMHSYIRKGNKSPCSVEEPCKLMIGARHWAALQFNKQMGREGEVIFVKTKKKKTGQVLKSL